MERGRIVSGGSGAEQGPSLLRCVRKDRAVRSGSSGGWARARKRRPVAGRAREATAEPAATEAAPRSVRLTPSGVRSNPPGEAADHAAAGR